MGPRAEKANDEYRTIALQLHCAIICALRGEKTSTKLFCAFPKGPLQLVWVFIHLLDLVGSRGRSFLHVATSEVLSTRISFCLLDAPRGGPVGSRAPYLSAARA